MPNQLMVKKGNFLVAKHINVEPGVKPGMDVLHVFMENPEAELHQVSFAVHSNHTEGVIKVFKRLAPIRPLENKPEEMIRIERGAKAAGEASPGQELMGRIADGATDVNPYLLHGAELERSVQARKEGYDAPGAGICVDQSDRPGAGPATGPADEVGEEVSGQSSCSVPCAEGDAAREPEAMAGDHGDLG
ncbi:MAG: hypothetical protein NT047_00745 [Deltaproteobacteria bacterium]|nr:hypothetical protein [Deltaproteobacteria bacterium]